MLPSGVVPATRRLRCVRCGGPVPWPGDVHRMRQRVRAFALAALILYPAGITLPVIRLERLGHSRETGIISGGVELLTSGELALGILILVCSVAVPLLKLAGLLALSSPWPLAPHTAGWLHRILDATGRWGMLDVLLVAILAASVKLGDLVQISAGPGAIAFGVCVASSLVAAACFDPNASWHGESSAARHTTAEVVA